MFTAQTPLLSGLLKAQDRDNEVVGMAHIEDYAKLVIEFAQQCHDPILIPIGAGAQRLLGAVTLLAHNALDIPVYAHRFDGRDVLLVGTVTASLIEFEAAATNARRRGASGVHGCAVEVTGTSASSNLDSFTLLNEATQRVPRTA